MVRSSWVMIPVGITDNFWCSKHDCHLASCTLKLVLNIRLLILELRWSYETLIKTIIIVHHHMLNLSTKLTLRFVLRLKTSFTKLTIKLASMTSSSIGKTKTSSRIVLKIAFFLTKKRLTIKGVWTTKVGIGILCKTISIPFCALLRVLTSNNNICHARLCKI